MTARPARYRPHQKDGEGNVFAGVSRLSVNRGYSLASGPRSSCGVPPSLWSLVPSRGGTPGLVTGPVQSQVLVFESNVILSSENIYYGH